MRRLCLTFLMMMWAGAAQAYVADALGVVAGDDGRPDIAASFNAPFEPLAADQAVGSITLVRESLTGEQRLRVESCAALMDVYYDGAWEVESQDTAFYTGWVVARCIVLDHLMAAAGNAALNDDVPTLDLSANDLPAHLAPYENCQDRIDHMRAALAGETLDSRLGDAWDEADENDDQPGTVVFETPEGRTLNIEVLGSYVAQGRPIWVVLTTQNDPALDSTVMEVWQLTVDKDENDASFVRGLDLVQAALTTCPSFLPLLLTDECP